MNEKSRNIFYYICSLLVIISAIGFFFDQVYSPYVFAVAGAGVAVALLSSPYKGDNLRLRRLNIQQAIAALLLPISSYFMFSGRNEWFMFLLISAVLQLYTVLVKDYELKKENGKDKQSPKQPD